MPEGVGEAGSGRLSRNLGPPPDVPSPGQDPAAVARALLREAEEPKSFNHPISYPKLGLA
jgi:hypothetical protein